jgi:hypothetical protein
MADTERGFYRFSVLQTSPGNFMIRATPIGFHIKGYGLIGLGLVEGTTLEEAMHLADHMNRPGRAAESATAFK